MKKLHLTNEKLADFFAELYALRQSEISESEALQIMVEGQDNKVMQDFLKSLIAAPNLIRGLAQFPAVIPDYIIALLTHTSDIQVLNDIAEHLNKLSFTDSGISYRQQLINYLLYPVAILMIALLLTSIMLIYVIPVFEDLFNGIGAELPALTRLFIELGHYAPIGIGLLLILSVILFIMPYQSKFKSTLLLRSPIIGRVTACVESATVINTLYLLSCYQFKLAEALRLCATSSQNSVVISALIDSADNINKELWLDSLKHARIFSVKTLLLLNVFAKTEQLLILKTLTASYHKSIYKEITLSLRLLNTLLLISCWLIVGVILIALYLPIFQIGAAIG